MIIDENEFFREVSVRMCGSLEIDKALRLCFQFVSQVMPVDKLIIMIYDRGTKCFRSVATADSQGAHLTSEEIFLPPYPPPADRGTRTVSPGQKCEQHRR